MDNVLRYKQVKETLKGITYKDYPFDRILGSYIATYIWSNPLRKLRFLFYCIRYEYSLGNGKGLLISIQSPRESYFSLLQDFVSKEQYSKSSIKNIHHKKKEYKDLFFIIVSFLKNFFKYYDNKRGLHFNVIILILIINAKYLIDKLETKKYKYDSYIAFNSSYLFESFLSFYFKKRGKKTQSIQHGMYFDYSNDPPLDIINYENICADELLCWGEYSRKQIYRYVHPSVKIIINGYPRKISYSNGQEKSNKILVLLPREIYLKEIKDLLNILESVNEDIILRPHPTLIEFIEKYAYKKENIEINNETDLLQLFKKYAFKACIGFNSSSLFEAMIFRQNVIRYISSNNEFSLDEIPSFSNKKDIYRAIDASKFIESTHKYNLNYFFNL